MKNATIAIFLLAFANILWAQCYWQQRVEYQMNIIVDVKKHRFEGRQVLTYFNNSPDTLYRVYYHLYFNAFQPNSMMDVRSRTLPDPDSRVGDRIYSLDDDEIGYQHVQSLTQNGRPVQYHVSETVLEADLASPIPPGGKSTFSMDFEAQVPLQIRRSGRDSYEGVDYSMAQWYPKMAEYDRHGWHAHPYVAREFYAPWGDFDVKITIDKDYILGATGILQNPNEIGYGYEDLGTDVPVQGKTLTWHFRAENVHDFVWAADTDYSQTSLQVPGGPLVRFFYIPGDETKHWIDLPHYTQLAFEYIQRNFGEYGWEEYSIIQGGDGGMEYPMATLIANKRKNYGVRSLKSLVGVAVHEILHSWYQGMLATNESYYAWMDEGFTSYAEAYTMNYIFDLKASNPLEADYASYIKWTKTGLEEPLSTHADHFSTNTAYSRAAYTKGAVTLGQLGYIIGQQNLSQGLLAYRNQWAFKHPDMHDFIRLMEKQSRLELDWYFDYWINTTHTIDYAISSVKASTPETTEITLQRIGKMPMPIDLYITKSDGTSLVYYIPLGMMRGEKPHESATLERLVGQDWMWTHPEYTFTLDLPLEQVEKVHIDLTERLADVDKANNTYTRPDTNPVDRPGE